MAQSFVDLQNQALSRDFDAATYRSEARQAILDALGEISRKVQLPANERVATITLVPGQASYTLPSANIRVLGIFRDHEPLHYIPQAKLDDQDDALSAPTAYALRSDIQRRDRSRVSQVPGMYPIPSGPRFVRP
jgi:hypothetical protein